MGLFARLATSATLMTAWITACGGSVVTTSSDTAPPDSSTLDGSIATDATVPVADATVEETPDAAFSATPDADADSGLCSDVITNPGACLPPGGGIFTRPINLSCAGDASASLDAYCSSLGVPNEGKEWGLLENNGTFVCTCSGPG